MGCRQVLCPVRSCLHTSAGESRKSSPQLKALPAPNYSTWLRKKIPLRLPPAPKMLVANVCGFGPFLSPGSGRNMYNCIQYCWVHVPFCILGQKLVILAMSERANRWYHYIWPRHVPAEIMGTNNENLQCSLEKKKIKGLITILADRVT